MSNKNQFGEALSGLIDQTNVYYRDQWSSYLAVSTSAISQWVTGKTLPRAEYLQLIVSHLENYDKEEVQKKLQEFYQMADQPIGNVMPPELAERLKGNRTISDYLVSDYFFPLKMEISSMPGQVKKDFIFLCTAFSRSVNKFCEYRDEQTIHILKEALDKIHRLKVPILIQEVIEKDIYKNNKMPYPEKVILPEKIRKHTAGKANNKYLLESLYMIDNAHNDFIHKCEVLLWNFKKFSPLQALSSIDAEEIVFVKIKGKLKWKFENSMEFDLSKNNILWLKSTQLSANSDRVSCGFPSSTLEVEEDGYAIVILFNEKGVRLDKVRSQDDDYEKVTYLKGIITHNQFKNNGIKHALHSLPVKKTELLRLIKKHKVKDLMDGHEKLRLGNVLDEAYLSEIFQQESTVSDPMFSMTVIHFKNTNEAKSKIKLIRHYGAEIFIPLSGNFKLLTTGVKDGDSIETVYDVADLSASEIYETVVSGLDVNKDTPSILFLNSETPHAFASTDEDGGTCLHIRVLRHVSDKMLDDRNNVVTVPVVNAFNTYQIRERER